MIRSSLLPALLLLLALPSAAPAANPGSARTGSGQTLNVRIDAPANGATVPRADLAVRGVAGIGALSGSGATNVVYVVDTSGSTGGSAGDCNGDGATNAGDDLNGDNGVGTILDCELGGVLALNASLAGSGVGSGLVAFADSAGTADMSAAGGQQDFTTPGPDVDGVARSVRQGQIGSFTAVTGLGFGTNFDAAIERMNAAFAGRSGQRNIGAFLSDGGASLKEGAGSAVEAARAAGTRINTYSVGPSGAGCTKPESSLKKIADLTGGTCTEVQDPTRLSAALAGAAGAGLQGVSVRIGSGAPVAATVTGLGTFSATLPASALRSGANTVTATATATDGTSAAADVAVRLGGGTVGSSTVGLPSNRRCISKRLFPITIRRRAGLTYDFATVVVNRRKVRVYVRWQRRWIRTGRPAGRMINVRVFKAYVDLRGLVKGRYTVKIVVVATNGRVITGSRKYRTCTRRLTGTVPRL
jgi:hypothetical protein